MNDVNEDWEWFLIAEFIISYYAYYLERMDDV